MVIVGAAAAEFWCYPSFFHHLFILLNVTRHCCALALNSHSHLIKWMVFAKLWETGTKLSNKHNTHRERHTQYTQNPLVGYSALCQRSISFYNDSSDIQAVAWLLYCVSFFVVFTSSMQLKGLINIGSFRCNWCLYRKQSVESVVMHVAWEYRISIYTRVTQQNSIMIFFSSSTHLQIIWMEKNGE